jgi:hypothetical protein
MSADADDITQLQQQAERLIAQAQRALQDRPGFFKAHAADAGQRPQALRRERGDALKADLALRLAAADRPAPGTPVIEPDSAAVFARRVRRRHRLV